MRKKITLNLAPILLPEVLLITSYPPRECGIATYSQDLIKALNNKFEGSFKISICALESENEQHIYADEIRYFLNTDYPNSFTELSKSINNNPEICQVIIQHEFGFFEKKTLEFQQLLQDISKPITVVFHTVLPGPNPILHQNVQVIASHCASMIVMTHSSAKILEMDYGISAEKITVIPHGTHLVTNSNKVHLKEKYQLTEKKVLSTFGLLSSGKSIETTLNALPAIVKKRPDVVFLIIGKTHPSVVKQEGEKYRRLLEDKVRELKLEKYVRFINHFIPLPQLLEYLQLSDIYLFTSKDPNQAVSGTFSYAISCGCSIISTPIPHAKEVLGDDTGIIVGFENSEQLSKSVLRLIKDEQLRKNISLNGLHKMAPTAWENSAIAHAMLIQKMSDGKIKLHYAIPPINLNHFKKMTTEFGMLQFSKINKPDFDSGYTLDDNARALVAMCQHYELSKDDADLPYIELYFNFIKHCLKDNGTFLNYVNEAEYFTAQNQNENLSDANGRAIWALGFLVSMGDILPAHLESEALIILNQVLPNADKMYSTRAMAFIIKGVYYLNTRFQSTENELLIAILANRLVQMYRHESDHNWHWFESYLTYANSILPEAMLCAWLATDKAIFKDIAVSSFEFLSSKTLNGEVLQVISNTTWLHKGDTAVSQVVGGEQPIDVAYSVMALSKFYEVFKSPFYLEKMEMTFDWFLGKNHLNQIVYNPCTGGCYDGLEATQVNLNQGAESTVSYLMARLTVEKSFLNQHQQSAKKSLLLKPYQQLLLA